MLMKMKNIVYVFTFAAGMQSSLALAQATTSDIQKSGDSNYVCCKIIKITCYMQKNCRPHTLTKTVPAKNQNDCFSNVPESDTYYS